MKFMPFNLSFHSYEVANYSIDWFVGHEIYFLTKWAYTFFPQRNIGISSSAFRGMGELLMLT